MNHTIILDKYHASPSRIRLGTYGSYGFERIHLEVSEEWKGLVLEASFSRRDQETVSVIVDMDTLSFEVPAEAVATAEKDGLITIKGVGEGKRMFSESVAYIVTDHGETGSSYPVPPTPTEVEQILQIANQAKENAKVAVTAAESADNAAAAANTAADNANRVADALAAEKNAGAFNGADGYTPVKGIDYGTPEEIDEISRQAANVLAPEVNQLKSDKADKTSLARTDRSLDALWKLNHGISYQFEQDNTECYQKTVPSGAKIASVHKIGGRTILWNQRVKAEGSEATDKGITYTNSNGIITVKGVATDVSTSRLLSNQGPYFVAGHKYLILGCPKGGGRGKYMIDTGANIGSDYGEGNIGMCRQTGYFYYFIYVYPDAGAVDLIFKPQLFDLTDMFGAGNEPASVEEFHSMFPDEYYPYNPQELKPIPVNEIVNSKADETVISTTEIPTGIIALDGYGVGNGTVYNYVDFENKQFVKRCEIVDGEVVEVEEPVITDISGLIGDTFQMPLTVEAGGTLTFQNANGDGYRVPVPSNIEYIVSLAEVNG